jgi:GrpB-like predicted nucleotidyltransferase (UPF0157 family)
VATLRPAGEIQERALEILATERERLQPLLAPHELRLTGGTSVAGALTKGDVDLHLRVDVVDFPATVTVLRRLYVVVHPHIWTGTLATFSVPAPLPTGVAVTPIGSEHDIRFTTTWQLLSAHPSLLAEYNAVKQTAGADYETRKSAFFDRLVKNAGPP